jgi:hypothetical protein
MRQRLGIADALVKSPDLLILDEPTTSIDPLGVVEILDLLRRLVVERGLAIMLSSHLLTQVQSVCDRIGIFAAGKLVGQGPSRSSPRPGDNRVIEVGLTADATQRAGRCWRPRLGRVDRGAVDGGMGTMSVRPTPRARPPKVRGWAVDHGLPHRAPPDAVARRHLPESRESDAADGPWTAGPWSERGT